MATTNNSAGTVTRESRSAVARARFFLQKAEEAPSDARIEFEAYLEAAIVFGRTAVHRLETTHKRQPGWKAWWDSMRTNPAMEFFRFERDWILKHGSAKVGQRLFVPTIETNAPDLPSPVIERAADYAAQTVRGFLDELARLIEDAEARFA